MASARLRCFLPCQYFQQRGWPSEVFHESHLADYQLVVFQKAYTEQDVRFASLLKERNAKVIFDLCDNHFYSLARKPENEAKLRRLKRMVELADLVTVSTAEVAKLIQPKQVAVIDDALDEFLEENWQSRMIRSLGLRQHFLSSRARLVWFGNAGTENPPFGLVNLAAIIPELNEVNRSAPLSLSVISNSKAVFKKHTRAAEFPTRFHEWNRLTFRALFQQHEVCLLPIAQNPFTICKSNNRVLLSLLLGVPVVADKISSYEEFSRWVRFSDWKNNLQFLLKNRSHQQQQGTEAAKFIRENYGPERTVRQWSAAFESLPGQEALRPRA